MLPPGIALAWVLARYRFRGKAVVETLVSLPLVMPPVATGLLLLWLVGRRGPIGRMLEPLGIEIVFTPAAAFQVGRARWRSASTPTRKPDRTRGRRCCW